MISNSEFPAKLQNWCNYVSLLKFAKNITVTENDYDHNILFYIYTRQF